MLDAGHPVHDDAQIAYYYVMPTQGAGLIAIDKRLMFILLLAGSARSDGTLPFHLLMVFLNPRMRDDKVVHDGYKAAATPRYIRRLL